MVNKKDETTTIDNNEEIQDITNEDTDTAAEEPEIEEIEDLEASKIQSLKEKNARLEDEKRDALEQLASAKADFLNAKKRLEEEKLRGIERQKIKDIEALLPLCDSFRMAMADKEAWEAADERWRKGVEGIHGQLQQILQMHNVTSIDPTGEPFNPELHDALSAIESDQDTDTVIETMQLGYKMGDTIIRHAKVVISS